MVFMLPIPRIARYLTQLSRPLRIMASETNNDLKGNKALFWRLDLGWFKNDFLLIIINTENYECAKKCNSNVTIKRAFRFNLFRQITNLVKTFLSSYCCLSYLI